MEVRKFPLDWSVVNQRKELYRWKEKSIPQILSNRAGVNDVLVIQYFWIELPFHYLMSLLCEDCQGQDLKPIVVTVRRIAAVEVPLASFITSRIVCISATLYGAVETLVVKESTSRQFIES